MLNHQLSWTIWSWTLIIFGEIYKDFIKDLSYHLAMLWVFYNIYWKIVELEAGLLSFEYVQKYLILLKASIIFNVIFISPDIGKDWRKRSKWLIDIGYLYLQGSALLTENRNKKLSTFPSFIAIKRLTQIFSSSISLIKCQYSIMLTSVKEKIKIYLFFC